MHTFLKTQDVLKVLFHFSFIMIMYLMYLYTNMSLVYVLPFELLNSFLNRGMLSHAVHPPTTEHVYAQWQEREKLSSRAPLGLLQDDNGQSLVVKEEEALSPLSGEPTSRNHFKTSRAVRHKFKGNAVNPGELIIELAIRNFVKSCAVFGPLTLNFCVFM